MNDQLPYIDEVFFEASPQVLYEGCLTVVVLQQDKVLHPDPVARSQGTLHHQAHSSFNINLLQEDRGRDITESHTNGAAADERRLFWFSAVESLPCLTVCIW